jgi:hypothetical protein
MFYWNYRIVNTKSENNGEDWYCLQEVYYTKDNKPEGYSAACTGSESMESMRDVWHMMQEAMELPPLQEEDFVNPYIFDPSSETSFVPPRSLNIAKILTSTIGETK